MKRIYYVVLLPLLAVACNITNTSPQSDQAEVGSIEEGQYRYISFSGTIETLIDVDTMGDFAGKAFEYGGDYQVELWFPMEGGQAVQQRNNHRTHDGKPVSPEAPPHELPLRGDIDALLSGGQARFSRNVSQVDCVVGVLHHISFSSQRRGEYGDRGRPRVCPK